MATDVVVLHQLPLEQYPPACNLLRTLLGMPGFRVAAITSPNQKSLPTFSVGGLVLHRLRFGLSSDSVLVRWFFSLLWHVRAALICRGLQPAAVISVEPHSAFAVWLYFVLLGGSGRLLIHHHEYYSPADYRRPGNRLTRLNRLFENRLLHRAIWVSQTNVDRLRLFRLDHPRLTDDQCHVLPNYPPADWRGRRPALPRRSGPFKGPLRLVYVGSVSLHDTFIGPLVEWLMSEQNPGCTLDLFCYNIDPRTRQFLSNHSGSVLRFHDHGVDYDQLPEVLSTFDVGLILYRCNTLNFVYNASNKLFEYLMCGLDVWYPACMLGVRPYARTDANPRVLETDFERLNSMEWESRQPQADLPWEPWTKSCEEALAPLFARLKGSSFSGKNGRLGVLQ